MPLYLCFNEVTTKVENNIRLCWKSLTNDETNKTCKDKFNKLQEAKGSCCYMFKYKIETMMVGLIQMLRITYEIKNSSCVQESKVEKSQLRVSIIQNTSVSFFQEKFNVMYWIFDINHNWSKELERLYMSKTNLHYMSNKL